MNGEIRTTVPELPPGCTQKPGCDDCGATGRKLRYFVEIGAWQCNACCPLAALDKDERTRK